MIEVRLTIDEHYEFIKLYDILRDMDFELTDNQQSVFEIAFGDNAINRDFSMGEVLDRLMEFSNNALKYEEGEE